MLVRFNMTKLESFTTMFLEGHPGQYHGTLIHAAQLSYASQMPFLKILTVSFFAKGNASVSKEQLPHHWLTLQNAYLSPRSQGLISERFVGLEGRNFHPVTYFQLH